MSEKCGINGEAAVEGKDIQQPQLDGGAIHWYRRHMIIHFYGPDTDNQEHNISKDAPQLV